MKSIKLTIFLIALTVLTCASENKSSDVMDMVQKIIDDPEFMVLSYERQIRILIHIYTMLEKHLGKNSEPKLLKSVSAPSKSVYSLRKKLRKTQSSKSQMSA